MAYEKYFTQRELRNIVVDEGKRFIELNDGTILEIMDDGDRSRWRQDETGFYVVPVRKATAPEGYEALVGVGKRVCMVRTLEPSPEELELMKPQEVIR